jgi:hypothetical protein
MTTKVLPVICSLIGLLVGILFALKPELLIRLQIKFYEKINWRMSPISMPLELRNTRLMGFILIAFSLLALVILSFFSPQ